MATNLPNLLTYFRILLVPLVVIALYLEEDAGNWTALALFAMAGITDWLDGYLARAWNQTSNLGRMLDPIADKLLVAVVLLALTWQGTIAGYSLWAAIIILCREILVSGLREYLAGLRVSVPVTQLAKWKTAIQMVALAFLLLGPAGDRIVPGITELGLTLLWAAAILTLYTGYDYFRAGLRHIDDTRPPERPAGAPATPGGSAANGDAAP
ncbi:cardiolipin synthase [Parvibaculum indicum]|uniref:CDP-diacylglycerol--glycerol-3-phosphate 3-phosphatidyltransferase n=1 Tax=Parvibaculum indicum TaxID=562969 RepID=UPI001424277E|nr:CDP-diacylglycerol--glycerol-3-phosphate 3-phosphatidyltransferase [Parvibaculum indicum]NIJ40239.1 cardiolipin synthase [Parvibaculum indicum]